MAGFSPFTRRLVALALLFFLVVGSMQLAVLPFASLVSAELTRLTDARFRLARMDALQARPAPPKMKPLAHGFYVTAANRSEAVTQIKGHLARIAATAQIKIDRFGSEDASATSPQSLALPFSVSGNELQLLGFLAQIEQGTLVMRLQSWRLSGKLGGQAGQATVPPVNATPQAVVAAPPFGASVPTIPSTTVPAVPQTSDQAVIAPGVEGPRLILDGVLLSVWERPQ